MTGVDRTDEYAGVPLPQVRIMTDRLLSPETTESVLNALAADQFIIDHIRRIDITGENLPGKIGSGPAKGLDNNHSGRKVIHFGKDEILLTKAVGDFYLELLVKDEEEQNEVVEHIKSVCSRTIPFGYSLAIGRYSKYRSTLSDMRN